MPIADCPVHRSMILRSKNSDAPVRHRSVRPSTESSGPVDVCERDVRRAECVASPHRSIMVRVFWYSLVVTFDDSGMAFARSVLKSVPGAIERSECWFRILIRPGAGHFLSFRKQRLIGSRPVRRFVDEPYPGEREVLGRRWRRFNAAREVPEESRKSSARGADVCYYPRIHQSLVI